MAAEFEMASQSQLSINYYAAGERETGPPFAFELLSSKAGIFLFCELWCSDFGFFIVFDRGKLFFILCSLCYTVVFYILVRF